MIYYFAALAVTACIVLLSQPKHAVNRSLAFFLLCAAVGGLTEWANTLPGYWLFNGITIINQTLTPYGALLFALAYTQDHQASGRFFTEYAVMNRGTRGLRLVLLLPVVLTVILTPSTPRIQLHELSLLLWAGPYYIATCVLLIRAYIREPNPNVKRKRFITVLLMVPTLIAVVLFINVARVVDPEFPFFNYVAGFIIYSLGAGLGFAFVTGALGVRLRLEQDTLESTMKAISSGTAILNHTIKNEIGKISLSTDNIQAVLDKEDTDPAVHAQLQIIKNASEHMQAMVTKIHAQMRTLILQEEPVALLELVTENITEQEPLLDQMEIHVVFHAVIRPVVICDKVHIKEALGNVIRNAVEAMPDGGSLELSMDATARKDVILTVRDTGSGMSEETRKQVMEPFYTTKSRRGNFGLGLTYTYYVMKQTGGSLQFHSREGEGTRVSFVFPRRKVTRILNAEEVRP
ncbi:hypothetical protein SY83_08785 [Paenibacillus swuensis]|uniref:histidine kinase n=1 Tax=Paenibacillus swuensis TaxID=1178515 RepID=A0A172TH31_9BACL|nr:sensor histidine kinase [Paenibacillus swuensis]ANE46359.1 hypothetical protein SY83_08785 [Paenibacillus swuensis]